MATGVDRRYLATAEEQTWVTRLTNWYILRISQLLASDPLVADRFSRVAHLLKPPTALFDPRIVWAVLRKELAVRRQKPTAPSITDEVIAPLPTPEMDAVAR
jgi:hypothetical protein